MDGSLADSRPANAGHQPSFGYCTLLLNRVMLVSPSVAMGPPGK